jgi:hypothetical protein
MINDGGHAFPNPDHDVFNYGEQNRGVGDALSKRDYFAARTMEALIGDDETRYLGDTEMAMIAQASYKMADAMLLARQS